jgi:beta-galactosidase
VKDHPSVIGDFVWTGIDYLGESGIGRYYYEGDVPGESWERPLFPWHAAYCGDIDLTGQRKPISHRRSMLWNADGEQLYMAVREPDGYYGKVKTSMWSTWPTFESWNWPGHEGKNIDVEVYAHYPKVRLTLDGQEVGVKEVKDGMATFTLPYQPGTLRAEGLAGDDVRASVVLATAGDAKTVRLSADHSQMKGDGQDLAFIDVELVDAKGRLNPTAAHRLTATVSGPATLAAFGNADVKDCDRYTDATHRAWKGRALLVVRSTGGKGSVKVTVKGDGLKPASTTLKCM